MNNNWTITVETDPDSGDIVLPLPPELLEQYGWQEGDDLIWTNNSDGTWSLEKEKT